MKYINDLYEQSALVSISEIKYKIALTNNYDNQFKRYQNFARLNLLSILIMMSIHRFP